MVWSPAHSLAMFFMWWVMMMIMMLPGITPKIWCYSDRKTERAGLHRYIRTLTYVTGYSVLWSLFSIIATIGQYALERLSLLHSTKLHIIEPTLTAGLLLAIGLYQFSPLKSRHLQKCRLDQATGNPMDDGYLLGFHCFINSSPLMLLLFVGGVMNLYWIVSLSILNTLERTLPSPRFLSSFVGIACIAAAGYVMILEG